MEREHPAQHQVKPRNSLGQELLIGNGWPNGSSGSDANGFVSSLPASFENTDAIPLGYYVAVVLICTVTTLVTLYHQQIVDFLRPAADWMHEYALSSLLPPLFP